MPILHGSSTDSWTLHGVTGKQDVSGPDLVTCHRDHLSITDSRGESSGISREKRAQSADRSHAFFIAGTGAIPRSSGRGYAPSQRQFPTVFYPKRRIYKRRHTGYDPSVAEHPPTGGSSVRPHWKQGRVCPTVGIKSHNKHRANTRRESHSESIAVCRTPRGQHNTGNPSPTTERRGEESQGGHSTPLPGDCPSTGHSPIPTVC